MHILLAYAPADGQEPAGRLAELLRAMGARVTEAGANTPLPQDASLIAILTPAALTDRTVLGLLQQVSVQRRPLLPLSAPNPASFPAPEDLARVLEWRTIPPAAAPGHGVKYHVVTAVNSAIGDNAVVVNTFGQGVGWSAAETAQLAMALRARQPAAAMSAQELRDLFAAVQAQVQQVERTLQQGFLFVLARFDLAEQRIVAPILARLDAQQTELLAAILDALETRAFPAAELGQHLAAIHLALAQINVRSAQIADRQLAESLRQAAELASDPGLDVKHKLKFTVPLVPLLLEYEGELELSSRLSLREAWRLLQERAGRSNRAGSS
jgi:hypothetical protein